MHRGLPNPFAGKEHEQVALIGEAGFAFPEFISTGLGNPRFLACRRLPLGENFRRLDSTNASQEKINGSKSRSCSCRRQAVND